MKKGINNSEKLQSEYDKQQYREGYNDRKWV